MIAGPPQSDMSEEKIKKHKETLKKAREYLERKVLKK